MTNIKSPAKSQMIDFIRNSEMEKPYVFKHEGNEDDAKRFVHRMRVELARMRELVKANGRTPVHFKMMLKEIDIVGHTATITLLKTTSARNVDNEVDAILDEIGGGLQIGQS